MVYPYARIMYRRELYALHRAGPRHRQQEVPPRGMSKMQEMQWKKVQAAKLAGGGDAPSPRPRPAAPVVPAAGGSGCGGADVKDMPPPGMSKMQEMKWKKEAARKQKEASYKATMNSY